MHTQCTHIKPEDVATQTVKSLVNSYLMARVYAESMREQVDQIYNQILSEREVFVSDEMVRRIKHEKRRITKHDDLYLASDDDAKACYLEASNRERAAGIKPDSMEDDYCPALVAESLQRDVEAMLINESGKPFGITADRVFLDKRQKWIDLIVGMVVNMPDFENPLTKAA